MRHVIDTALLLIDPSAPEPAIIARAAEVIRRGGLVAFPTETVYGLGADALDAVAVGRIYTAKGRDPSDPCIVHIAERDELARVAASVPPLAQRLADAFWPGPLSLVLPKAQAVPLVTTAGGPTVAVRMPDHPVALALILAAGTPIAAPSANRFMHTSPTTAQHVLDDLAGRIDLVLDGGPTRVGVESTVLDLTGGVPVLLRPGGVSLERLREVVGEVRPRERLVTSADVAASPGLMATHYAPDASVELYDGPTAAVLAAIEQRATELAASGERVGLLLADDDMVAVPAGADVAVARVGRSDDPDAVARRLFAALRELEAARVRVVLAHTFSDDGLGRAVRDRLVRAGGSRVIHVQ